jgi:hypothetical protein
MGQTCGKLNDTTETDANPPNMKLFFAACAGDRRPPEETVTKQIRQPPTRPTPVVNVPASTSASTASIDTTTTTTGDHSSLEDNNVEEDHFDLSSAPPLALPEHQDSYRVLLSLLRRHRTSVGSTLLPLLPLMQEEDDEEEEEEKKCPSSVETSNKDDYLLHLMCALPNVNTSVVGLLAFAHPRSAMYKSPRTRKTPLQVALSSRVVSMEVITLLFEYETKKTKFCQDTLDGGMLPLAVLLEPVTNSSQGTCSLRSSSLRHALFMRFVFAWKDSLKFVDKCWSDYYHAWVYMDEIGSGGGFGGGGRSGGGGGGPPHFYQCFSDLMLGGENEENMLGRNSRHERRKNREINVNIHDDKDGANEALVEGAHNLLSLLR